MNDPVAERLTLPDPLIAIVGATDSPGKYGGIIYRDMKAKGYRVVGVNPGRSTVDGDKTYPTLADLPEKPDQKEGEPEGDVNQDPFLVHHLHAQGQGHHQANLIAVLRRRFGPFTEGTNDRPNGPYAEIEQGLYNGVFV